MYGAALADEVALPLLEAWSGVPAHELSAAVGEKLNHRIFYTVFLKAMSYWSGLAISNGYCQEMPENPSVWHVYPEGGVAFLCERLAADLTDVIERESPVETIHVVSGKVVALRVKGRDREVAAVVSTAPCPILAKMVSGTDALQPMRRFRYRPAVVVNLRFDCRGMLPDTVLWTPEPSFPFFRLTETPLSMPWLAPPAGKTLITADLGCEVGDRVWNMDEEALGETCLAAITAIYPAARRFYLGCRVLKTPIAYPVYLKDYEPDRRRFEKGTGIEGLYSIGRNGAFAHILMEDIYWRTLRTCQEIVSGRSAMKKTVALVFGTRPEAIKLAPIELRTERSRHDRVHRLRHRPASPDARSGSRRLRYPGPHRPRSHARGPNADRGAGPVHHGG